MDTLYRRPLPDDAIGFSSPEGQAVFAEALAGGTMGGYFALAEQFHTQSDPAFCGLGSLVVALNALAIDPGRLWKGPWRWFSEDLLDCCMTLDQIRAQGIDLDTMACLARCNRADVEVVRPGLDDEPLRAAVIAASAGPDTVLIASYDRAALGQTGSGHFSPIGGYHRGRDLVLVLDVARFKYPPHWVALPRLAAAMRTTDPASGLCVHHRQAHPASDIHQTLVKHPGVAIVHEVSTWGLFWEEFLGKRKDAPGWLAQMEYSHGPAGRTWGSLCWQGWSGRSAARTGRSDTT